MNRQIFLTILKMNM